MRMEAYQPSLHRDACMALFDGHLGGLFRPQERTGYRAFLDHLPGPYLVGVEDGEVVACGGVAFEDEAHTLASICWTIVHRDHQKRGLGRAVLEACVAQATADPHCKAIRLETVPATAGFFERLGFDAIHTEVDGYGPGEDRVEMRRPLGA